MAKKLLCYLIFFLLETLIVLLTVAGAELDRRGGGDARVSGYYDEVEAEVSSPPTRLTMLFLDLSELRGRHWRNKDELARAPGGRRWESSTAKARSGAANGHGGHGGHGGRHRSGRNNSSRRNGR